MAIYTDRHILASMHDFKTNIAKYARMLERGQYAGVIVRRYNRDIGVFITNESQKRWEARQRGGDEKSSD